MPTYQYQCDACPHRFEEWQSFKDEPLTKCPQCKKKKIRRLITGGLGFCIKTGGSTGDLDHRFSDRIGDVNG